MKPNGLEALFIEVESFDYTEQKRKNMSFSSGGLYKEMLRNITPLKLEGMKACSQSAS